MRCWRPDVVTLSGDFAEVDGKSCFWVTRSGPQAELFAARVGCGLGGRSEVGNSAGWAAPPEGRDVLVPIRTGTERRGVSRELFGTHWVAALVSRIPARAQDVSREAMELGAVRIAVSEARTPGLAVAALAEWAMTGGNGVRRPAAATEAAATF
jgi:hypothetical protein